MPGGRQQPRGAVAEHQRLQRRVTVEAPGARPRDQLDRRRRSRQVHAHRGAARAAADEARGVQAEALPRALVEQREGDRLEHRALSEAVLAEQHQPRRALLGGGGRGGDGVEPQRQVELVDDAEVAQLDALDVAGVREVARLLGGNLERIGVPRLLAAGEVRADVALALRCHHADLGRGLARPRAAELEDALAAHAGELAGRVEQGLDVLPGRGELPRQVLERGAAGLDERRAVEVEHVAGDPPALVVADDRAVGQVEQDALGVVAAGVEQQRRLAVERRPRRAGAAALGAHGEARAADASAGGAREEEVAPDVREPPVVIGRDAPVEVERVAHGAQVDDLGGGDRADRRLAERALVAKQREQPLHHVRGPVDRRVERVLELPPLALRLLEERPRRLRGRLGRAAGQRSGGRDALAIDVDHNAPILCPAWRPVNRLDGDAPAGESRS